MNEITITKESALKAIRGAKNAETKAAIRILCNLTDKPETWEDICDQLNIGAELPFASPVNSRQEAFNSMWILDHLSELAWLNSGKVLDWDDMNQKKWFLYFNLNSGFGVSHSLYVRWYTYSTVGSRLSFPTQEWAEYAGKVFLKHFENFMIRKNN